jgi:hypothetical protein
VNKIPIMVRSASTWLCTALCLACASGEQSVWSSTPTEFPYAYYHDDCAPWDGRALTIVLSHEEFQDPFESHFPNVSIRWYRPSAQLAGSSFGWTGIAQDLGHASWCDSAEDCVVASAVRVRFDRAQPSPDELAGQAHLEFEGGEAVSGRFKARRLPIQMLCG